MNEPEACVRARELVRHAGRLGGPVHLMQLIVTKAEGFELLAWLHEQNLDNPHMDCEMLAADIDEAKAKDDPHLVLQHFTLLGLSIRSPVVH